MATITAPVKPAKTFRTLLCGVMASLHVISCNPSDEKNQVPIASHKNLVIDIIDPSGTAIGAGWPNPSSEFYMHQVTWLENNGGGFLAIYNISLRYPTELVIEIIPLLKVPNAIDVGEEETKKILSLNAEASQKNAIAKASFLSRLDSFIVSYDPKKSKFGDLSYINTTLFAVAKKVKSSAFLDYKKYVFIYSDLLDESTAGKKMPADSSLLNEINDSGSQIAICSLIDKHQENSTLSECKGTKLAAYADFLIFLNSQSKTTNT